MSNSYTIDANILIYTIDPRDPVKQAIATDLVRRAREGKWVVTVQAIGEFFHVVSRKAIMTRVNAAAVAERMLENFELTAATSDCARIGLREAASGHLSYWDAVMLSTAAAAGCTVCFSEDMGDGARLGSIEVVNPFGPSGLTERAARLLSPTP